METRSYNPTQYVQFSFLCLLILEHYHIKTTYISYFHSVMKIPTHFLLSYTLMFMFWSFQYHILGYFPVSPMCSICHIHLNILHAVNPTKRGEDYILLRSLIT